MQTTKDTLVVLQNVVTQILLSCTLLDGKCILQFAIIISVNADFLSMKELKSICTIRVFLNSNIYTEVVHTNNNLHTHCDLKCTYHL